MHHLPVAGDERWVSEVASSLSSVKSLVDFVAFVKVCQGRQNSWPKVVTQKTTFGHANCHQLCYKADFVDAI